MHLMLPHVANMYLTVNGSSWNQACAEKCLLTNFAKFHGNRATSTLFSHCCRKTYWTDLVLLEASQGWKILLEASQDWKILLEASQGYVILLEASQGWKILLEASQGWKRVNFVPSLVLLLIYFHLRTYIFYVSWSGKWLSIAYDWINIRDKIEREIRRLYPVYPLLCQILSLPLIIIPVAPNCKVFAYDFSGA